MSEMVQYFLQRTSEQASLWFGKSPRVHQVPQSVLVNPSTFLEGHGSWRYSLSQQPSTHWLPWLESLLTLMEEGCPTSQPESRLSLSQQPSTHWLPWLESLLTLMEEGCPTSQPESRLTLSLPPRRHRQCRYCSSPTTRSESA